MDYWGFVFENLQRIGGIMRSFFFSLLLFFLLIFGVNNLKANESKSDFIPKTGDNSSFISPSGSTNVFKSKIKISGRALRPDNILVKEGDRVSAGVPLISRKIEIETLELQRSKVLERIAFLENQQLIKPIEPINREYPKLPLANFEAETLQIFAIASRCNRAEIDLENAKNSNINYLSAAPVAKLEKLKQQKNRELFQSQDLLNNLKSLNFEAHYISHQEEKIKILTAEIEQIDADILVEQGKLKEKLGQMEANKSSAIASSENALLDCRERLQISQAQLEQSKYQREILEQNYARSLAIHLQEQDKAAQIYQRDLIEYNKAVEALKLNLFDAEKSLSEIEFKLAEITEIKAPYNGEITRIKVVNSTDGYLNVEFTLLY